MSVNIDERIKAVRQDIWELEGECDDRESLGRSWGDLMRRRWFREHELGELLLEAGRARCPECGSHDLEHFLDGAYCRACREISEFYELAEVEAEAA